MIGERHFPALLGVVYEAALDFSTWERVLREIAGAFDGNGCVLGISGTGRQFSAYVAPLTEPAFLTSYNAYYLTGPGGLALFNGTSYGVRCALP